MRLLLAILAGLLIPASAHAYIGPGAGLGAFAFLIGMGVVLVLLFVGFVWFPMKRMLKRRK